MGRGKDSRRESAKNSKSSKAGDSGVESASDTDEDGNTTDSESEETTERQNMFAGDIKADEIEVWEGIHIGNKALLEVRYPEGAELSNTD